VQAVLSGDRATNLPLLLLIFQVSGNHIFRPPTITVTGKALKLNLFPAGFRLSEYLTEEYDFTGIIPVKTILVSKKKIIRFIILFIN
jgi:hypothetical protein